MAVHIRHCRYKRGAVRSSQHWSAQDAGLHLGLYCPLFLTQWMIFRANCHRTAMLDSCVTETGGFQRLCSTLGIIVQAGVSLLLVARWTNQRNSQNTDTSVNCVLWDHIKIWSTVYTLPPTKHIILTSY
jgi:hypothetical protein